MAQSTVCPSTLPSLEIIDQKLKEFVRLHHLDLIRTIDYEQKAEAYRQKSGSLWIVFDEVVHLLNDLRSKDQIRASQLDKMMPKQKKIALTYLYFIHKSHKVTNAHIARHNITMGVSMGNRQSLRRPPSNP